VKVASVTDEIHIRSIEVSRGQALESQAKIEKCLGGLDLSQYERPFQHLSSDELWELSQKCST
jgi:hypothetical protein